MVDPTAVTGRGLMLVSATVDAWGVGPLPAGKSVWCELRVGGRLDTTLVARSALARRAAAHGPHPR